MKRILVIEDSVSAAKEIAETLENLGDIKVCTSEGVSLLSKKMPPIGVVIEKIKMADIILLDMDLRTNYNGNDLLQYCEGKKVIGISSSYEIGEKNFFNKEILSREYIKEVLRKIVKSVM